MNRPHCLIVDSKVLIKYMELFQENIFEYVYKRCQVLAVFRRTLFLLATFLFRSRRGERSKQRKTSNI